MATQYIHDDIRDYGLTVVSNSANWHDYMRSVVCAGTPANLTEATALYPTGKRLTGALSMVGADFTLQDRSAGGREVAVADKDFTVAAVLAGGDLTVALYDSDRLLVVADCTNQDLPGENYLLPVSAWSFGFGEP